MCNCFMIPVSNHPLIEGIGWKFARNKMTEFEGTSHWMAPYFRKCTMHACFIISVHGSFHLLDCMKSSWASQGEALTLAEQTCCCVYFQSWVLKVGPGVAQGLQGLSALKLTALDWDQFRS